MKKYTVCFLAAVLALLLAACGSSKSGAPQDGTVVYCLEADEEALATENYAIDLTESETAIQQILDTIANGPGDSDHQSLLPKDVTMQSYSYSNGAIVVNFSPEYGAMTKDREVLARAGIVRSLMQIEGVRNVSFTIEGAPIMNSKGEEIGTMTSDTFIENSGRQINSYSHASINLYYASDDGKHLKRESRSIYYSSSKSIEWAIVERLISGPKVKGNYAVIPPNTHIISITTSEGTCYVNLDESFVSKTLNVSDRLIIYSIVNSLVENCGVTSVQFSVAGETDVKFGPDISLAKPFTEDMSLIAQ